MLVTYRYPGDPPTSAILMFGADFLTLFPHREIVISGAASDDVTRIPVDDIVCDTCNASIDMTDPCVLVPDSRLYCWECFQHWIKPHIEDVSHATETQR